MVNQCTDLASTLDNSTILSSSTKKNVKSGFSAKMTLVNDALGDESFRNEVWRRFDLPENVVLPQIPGSILYGDVSTAIHLPGLRVIYVAEDNIEEMRFYQFVNNALKSKKEIVSYSEGEAALYDESEKFI